ncbi:hypothetical protein ABT297_10085 [Dactylosporangium sp. NPDC000555]|uniref:hypothetical protein n=1 Tax=Dactylosporangium sp. NPDC000555 TaxID=3154260 RepID=UPI0033212D5B
MAEQYAGALLYLVPVVVAAVVAFIVTRPEKDAPAEPDAAGPPPQRPERRGAGASAATRPYVPAQRTHQPLNRRTDPPTVTLQPSPTLLHAALSSHLAAVSDAAGAAGTPASAKRPVVRSARLVSIRRPARIPRRPIHRCPRSS